MEEMEKKVAGGIGVDWIEAVDAVGFAGPGHFAREGVPTPTTRAAQPLPFRQVGLTPAEFFYRLLASGDVCGYAPDRVNVSAPILQGKFMNDGGVRAILVHGPFFEFDGRARFNHLQVVGSKRRGLPGGENLF